MSEDGPRHPFVEFVIDRKTGQVRHAGADLACGPTVTEFRERAERSLFTFAYGVMGFTQMTEHLHAPLCYLLTSPRYQQVNLVIPRSHLKTSMLLSLVPHAIIQPPQCNVYFPNGMGEEPAFDGSNTRVLWAGETDTVAEKNSDFIRRKFESAELLRGLWPHKVWEKSEKQARKWTKEAFFLPRTGEYPDPTMTAAGVNQAVTGGHFNLFVIDDVATAKAAGSRLVMDQTIEWIRQARDLRDNQEDFRLVSSMTRWAMWDPSPFWEEEEPYNARTGKGVYQYVRSAIEGGKAIFPEKHSLESLLALQKANPVRFSFQYMNNPMDPSIVSFDLAMLRACEIGDPGEIDVRDGVLSRPLRAFYEEDLRDARNRETMLGPVEQSPRDQARNFDFPGGVELTGELLEMIYGEAEPWEE